MQMYNKITMSCQESLWEEITATFELADEFVATLNNNDKPTSELTEREMQIIEIFRAAKQQQKQGNDNKKSLK